MKRILITGANSYIGTSVEKYLARYNAQRGREEYRIDTLSQLDESWEGYSFALYDTVFHVSGIAHADVGKASKQEQELYYRVNRDLAETTARRAKEQGVGQFIFMSSVIVYGDSAPLGKSRHITEKTEAAPANFYGDSKLQAEQRLRALESESFHVAILRPPMIYGKGCRGNYPVLAGLAEKTPVFPAVENQRSMLYIENLAEFVRLLIDRGIGGTFFPQNAEYVTTSRLVAEIGAARGKEIRLWKCLSPLVKLAGALPGRAGKLTQKAFGSLTIDQTLSRREIDGYQLFSLSESVRRTEGITDENFNYYGGL